MSTIKLTIDETELEVEPGTTILEAARIAGADIPTFCYDPQLPPNGACRICVVEVEKAKALVASCVTPVAPGMIVHTESERVVRARQDILKLMVANHPLVCITCEKTGECKLQDYCYRYGITDSEYLGEVKELSLDDSNQFFIRDMNKCILCGICVGKCQEVVGAGAIDFTERGFASNVGPAYEDKIEDSTCVFCGLCIDSCPVGALTPKSGIGKGRPWELEKTKAICPYCSVGCGIYLHTHGNQITGVTPDKESPVNRGQLCASGKFGWDYQQSAERITAPLVKSEGVFIEVTWEEALGFIVDNLDRVRKRYGDASVMGLCSPKVTNEESYLFQKLIRSMGTNNIDSHTRYSHVSAIKALRQSLGSTAMTNSIEELVGAKALLVIEAVPLRTHPVIGYPIREAVRCGAKLISANEKQAGFRDIAHQVMDLKPGGAVVLAHAMANVIISEELYDHKYVSKRTEGFENFKKGIASITPELAAGITGVTAVEIREAARIYAGAESAAIISSAMLNDHEHGEELVLALVNLALLTGNIGKKSSGLYLPFGENNLQGCGDMGIMPTVLTGYQSVTEKAVREKFSHSWQIPISKEPGLSVDCVFVPQDNPAVKAMLILGENPAACGEGSADAINVLKKLDFLLVQEMFMTETAALADVVLPAAAFAEKMGTYTNTERRVQLNMPAVDSPGDVYPDWQVIAELAGWLGFEWEYESPEDIFDEIIALTPQYAGINYSRLLEQGLQWPCKTEEHPGTEFIYEGRFRRGLGLLTTPDSNIALRVDGNLNGKQQSSVPHVCGCAGNEMKRHSIIANLE